MTAAQLLADCAALEAAMELRTGERIVAAVPMSHSYGLSLVTLPPLVRAVEAVVPFDHDPLDAAERHGATVLPTVPAWLQGLLKRADPARLPPTLRLVVSAAAPLSAETARAFRRRFGLPIHVLYGASECGAICYDRSGDAAERGTVGAPLPSARVTLGGAESSDAEGVVAVSSPAVACRYLPRRDRRLRDGRFESGDRGRFEAGELRLLGRVDARVNIDGRKVDPREIEEVLLRLPGVEEAVVLGVAAPERGGQRLRAVVACPQGRLGYRDVVAWCREHLATWKVPRSVLLVERVPRDARGKVDRAACLRGARDPRDGRPAARLERGA